MPVKTKTINGAGKIGRAMQVESAVTVTLGMSFNGSGPTAFGGAKEWPSLRVICEFEEHDYQKREQVAAELLEVLARHFTLEGWSK